MEVFSWFTSTEVSPLTCHNAAMFLAKLNVGYSGCNVDMFVQGNRWTFPYNGTFDFNTTMSHAKLGDIIPLKTAQCVDNWVNYSGIAIIRHQVVGSWSQSLDYLVAIKMIAGTVARATFLSPPTTDLIEALQFGYHVPVPPCKIQFAQEFDVHPAAHTMTMPNGPAWLAWQVLVLKEPTNVILDKVSDTNKLDKSLIGFREYVRGFHI